MNPHASRKSLFDFRLSKKLKRASANSYRSGNVNGSRSNQGRGAGGARSERPSARVMPLIAQRHSG